MKNQSSPLAAVSRCLFCIFISGVMFGFVPSVFGQVPGGAEKVEQAAALKKKIRYRVPFASRKAGAEITLKFQVKEDGSVDNITVVKFTDPDLIDPVYSAYENAKYIPAMKGGEPVSTWVTVTEKIE